jgi:hypothetical protein
MDNDSRLVQHSTSHRPAPPLYSCTFCAPARHWRPPGVLRARAPFTASTQPPPPPSCPPTHLPPRGMHIYKALVPLVCAIAPLPLSPESHRMPLLCFHLHGYHGQLAHRPFLTRVQAQQYHLGVVQLVDPAAPPPHRRSAAAPEPCCHQDSVPMSSHA